MFEEYNLFDSPSRISNCDETGLCHDCQPPSVVAIKRQRNLGIITTVKRQTTIGSDNSENLAVKQILQWDPNNLIQ